jgi:hypothetical protein
MVFGVEMNLAAPDGVRKPEGGNSIMYDDEKFSDLIAELRQEDGKMLRRLLKHLREKADPDSKDLYVTLVQHPELHDLVPN